MVGCKLSSTSHHTFAACRNWGSVNHALANFANVGMRDALADATEVAGIALCNLHLKVYHQLNGQSILPFFT